MRKVTTVFFVQVKEATGGGWKNHNCNYQTEPYGFATMSDGLRRKNMIVNSMAHPERGPIFRVEPVVVNENPNATI